MILANKPDQWIEPIGSIITNEACLPSIDFYRPFALFRARLFLLSQEFSINIFLSVEIFKEFLEDAYEVLPYPLPVLPKKELGTSMYPKPPTEVAIVLPEASFWRSFRDIDSKVRGEEEYGPKWLSKRKAAVLAVPLASCECRPSLGGSYSQLRKSPQRSELRYRYLLLLRESLQRLRLRRCSRGSSLRKSHRAETNENELPLELFIIREDLAARFLWGETIELKRSAEPQWDLL